MSSPFFIEPQPEKVGVLLFKRKNSIFLTPLNCDLNAFILALKDSAEALVLLLSK